MGVGGSWWRSVVGWCSAPQPHTLTARIVPFMSAVRSTSTTLRQLHLASAPSSNISPRSGSGVVGWWGGGVVGWWGGGYLRWGRAVLLIGF